VFQSWFVRLNVILICRWFWGDALVVGVAAFERCQHSAPSPRRTERRRIDVFDVDGMATCTLHSVLLVSLILIIITFKLNLSSLLHRIASYGSRV